MTCVVVWMNLFERVLCVCWWRGWSGLQSMKDVCSCVSCSLSPLSSFKGVNGWALRLRRSSVLEEAVGCDCGEDSSQSWHSWEGAGSIAAVLINTGIACADLSVVLLHDGCVAEASLFAGRVGNIFSGFPVFLRPACPNDALLVTDDLEDFSTIFFSTRTILQGALPLVYAHVIVLVAFRILVTVALVTLDGVTNCHQGWEGHYDLKSSHDVLFSGDPSPPKRDFSSQTIRGFADTSDL